MQRQAYELIKGIEKEIPTEKIIWHKKLTVPYFIFWRAKRKAVRILKKDNIALIHMNDGLMTLSIKSLKKITSLPIMCTFHGLDLVYPNKLYQKLLTSRMKKLDKVITVSHATKTECIRRGIDKKSLMVISNGVDTTMSQIRTDPKFRVRLEERIGISLEGKKILLSVGRPLRRKGLSWFIEKVLVHLGNDIIYLVAGSSLEREKFTRFVLKLIPKNWAAQIALIFGIGLDRTKQMKLIRQKNLKHKVFLLGKLPFKDLIQLYKHCDLFIMPNIPISGDMEGFGLTALEAAVNGAVVVASNLEGIKDAITDGKNGFLVEPLNSQIWRNKITNLLKDQKKLWTYSKRFQNYTAKYCGWEKMTEKYSNLFKIYMQN